MSARASNTTAPATRPRIIVGEGPEQRIRSTEYDRDHRVIAEVDGNGVRTEYRYDGQGNRTDVFQAVNRRG